MRCGCPLRNLVCCCAFAIALLPVLLVGGCGPIPFDAGFQPSADDNVLGTLVDDRGSFTFNLNPDTGNIQSIDADNGTITPPTDGQDLSIARDTGGSLTVSPEGASDVIVAVRGDPIVGDLDLQVDRTSLSGLALLVRANAQATATCADNQGFLDDTCTTANAIDVDEIVSLIRADLELRGQDVPASDAFRALLVFYLEPFLDCCLAWDEYRSGGGDACAEG
ncbi:MAG: hypothetical protein O7D91_02025 [Planctomycetota bacterium]|nr:hypothetical protein [Planctomycetota bacterium]